MALSRSLLAGHVLQSPAGRPRKHGQQRHLLRAGDSARWRRPAQSSPPRARPPPRGSLGLPAPRAPPALAIGPAGGRKGLVGGASGRTRAGREARAPWRQHTQKHFPAHSQAERAREGRVRGREWGRGLVILVLGSREGESDSPGPETSHARGSKARAYAAKDAAKVSQEAEA